MNDVTNSLLIRSQTLPIARQKSLEWMLNDDITSPEVSNYMSLNIVIVRRRELTQKWLCILGGRCQ